MSWYEPDEPLIAPCCENCDGDRCPGEDYCFTFLYSLRRERFYTQEEYDKLYNEDIGDQEDIDNQRQTEEEAGIAEEQARAEDEANAQAESDVAVAEAEAQYYES